MSNEKDHYTTFPVKAPDLEKTVYSELSLWAEEQNKYVDFAQVNNIGVDPAMERLKNFEAQQALNRPKIHVAEVETSILFVERVAREPKRHRFSLRHKHEDEPKEGFRKRLSLRFHRKERE